MFDDYDYQGLRVNDSVYVKGYGDLLEGKIVGIFEPFYGSANYLFCVDVGKTLNEKLPDLPRVAVGAPNLWEAINAKTVAFGFATIGHFHRVVAMTPRLSFSGVLKHEAKHPGLYYKRVDDGDFEWSIRFDPKMAGRLTMYTRDKVAPSIELYHHDLADGVYVPYTDMACKRAFKIDKKKVDSGSI